MLKRLHEPDQALLRSTYTISSLRDCLVELVYNSLDSKSRQVQVRFQGLDLTVTDNGSGIDLQDLRETLGKRSRTGSL